MQQVSRQPRNRNRQQVSDMAVVLATFIVLILAGWAVWHFVLHHKPAAASGPVAVNTQPGQAGPMQVTSADGGFSVVIPSGWGKVLKIADGDRLVIAGTDQPTENATQPVRLEQAASYDDNTPAVLDIQIASGLPTPEGQASDLQVGSGRQLLSGKKFSHNYDSDGPDALGHARKQGEKDYIYSFSLGNDRELRVTYSVYASDARDQSATVDQLVRSIRKLK
jgi:hypothetical protein